MRVGMHIYIHMYTYMHLSLSHSDSLSYAIEEKKRGCGYDDERKESAGDGEIKSFRGEKISPFLGFHNFFLSEIFEISFSLFFQ